MKETSMLHDRLTPRETGLLVVDVQEKLVKLVDRSAEVLHTIQKVIKGFQVLNIPIVVTEQYPQGLGETLPAIKSYLGEQQQYFSKTSFSCLGEPSIKSFVMAMPAPCWVLIGIEAHVCVLQSAKDLIAAGKKVIVLNDAITSRSIFDYSTAIAELRDAGARITSSETVLFELLADSKKSEFKAISQLIK
jgi:nicotinamidase-related amidase